MMWLIAGCWLGIDIAYVAYRFAVGQARERRKRFEAAAFERELAELLSR